MDSTEEMEDLRPMADGQVTVRPRSGVLAVVVGLLLLVSFAGLVALNNLFIGPYRGYSRYFASRIALEEAALFAGMVFLAAPAVLLLSHAAATPASAFLRRFLARALRRPRRVVAGCAVLALGVTALAGVYVVQHSPLTNEEQTLLFQADLLRTGRMSAPAPASLPGIEPPGVWVRDGQWTAQGQWGHAAVLAAGKVAGAPFLLPHLAAPLLIYLTWLLAGTIFPADPRTRLSATILFTLSPFLLFTTASFNPATSSAVATLLAAVALGRHARGGRLGWAVVAGLALGFGLHVRPVNAIVLGGVYAGLALVARATERRSVWPTLVGLVVGLVPAAALHYLLRQRGYATWIPLVGEAADGDSIGRSVTDALRIAFWMSGCAFTCATIILAASGFVRRRSDWLLLVPVVALLVATIGWDRAPEMETGPVAYLDVLPLCAIFVARTLVVAHERLAEAWRGPLLAGVAISIAVGMVTWWPVQAYGVYTASESVVSPYRLVNRLSLPPSYVLWHMAEPLHSWVTQPRPPSPKANDNVIFLRAEEDDWLAKRIGNRRQVDGRRVYQVLQSWAPASLLAWRPWPPPPPDEEDVIDDPIDPPLPDEPVSRPQRVCEPDPRNQCHFRGKPAP